MPRFFSEEIEGDRVFLRGEDARHIQKSLRMQLGDPLTVCDLGGTALSCRIEEFSPDLVTAAILERRPSEAEPTVQVRLYQALPKGDKLDLIVQKAVELGADQPLYLPPRRQEHGEKNPAPFPHRPGGRQTMRPGHRPKGGGAAQLGSGFVRDGGGSPCYSLL